MFCHALPDYNFRSSWNGFEYFRRLEQSFCTKHAATQFEPHGLFLECQKYYFARQCENYINFYSKYVMCPAKVTLPSD